MATELLSNIVVIVQTRIMQVDTLCDVVLQVLLVSKFRRSSQTHILGISDNHLVLSC